MAVPPSKATLQLPVDRLALAGLVWLGSVWLGAPALTWLDSSELTAAGVVLGVPHAPGHPLYVLLAHLASLIPVGTAAFRVALLSGLFAAAAAWFTADLVDELSWDKGSRTNRTVAGLSVALILCASTAIWQQAVRAEVYTLHLALMLWATRDALRWRRDTSERRHARLATVALIMGLGCANHHLLTLLHLPALLVLLMARPPEANDSRSGRLARAVAWALPAALLYAVLPLRAMTDPLINYGDPRTLGRLWDLVSAQAFQSSVTESSSPISENIVVAIEMLHDAIGAPILLLALVGAYLLSIRSPVLATACAVALVGNLASKVSMVIDPSNPDAYGYFQMSLALIAALAGVALVWTLEHSSSVVRLTGVSLMGFAALWAGTASLLSFQQIDHSTETTPMMTDMALLRDTPPNALWLTSNTFLHFNRLAHQAVDGYRPDVLAVHQGLERNVENGAPLREILLARDPGLAPLLQAASEGAQFPRSGALELAQTRPIMVEPSVSQPFDVADLSYAGGYMRVVSGDGPISERSEAQALDEARIRVAASDAFNRRREARTVHAILWLQLTVLRLQRGEAASARSALDHVLAIAPTSSRYIDRLRPFVEDLEANGASRALGEERVRRADFTRLFE
ncbi:MAG: hypothetical protein CL940_08110 [Deltaproteobacteria bacterium]|nr:hypothetical protein [Deltaproteobacteria bacterium]